MSQIGRVYYSKIQKHVKGSVPEVPFFSSVLGREIDKNDKLDAQYWQANLESPVLFDSAVKALIRSESHRPLCFAEVGPHSALAGPLRQIFKATSCTGSYVPTLVRNEDAHIKLLTSLGQLFAHGFPLSFDALFLNEKVRGLTDLPNYPWHHDSSHWTESRVSREWRFRKFAHHDVLGSRIIESTDQNPSWRNVLHLKDIPWARDHKILDDIVYPFAGYVAMAGEAARQLAADPDVATGFHLKKIVVHTAMVLREEQPTEIITSVRPQQLTDTLTSSWYSFQILSRSAKSWTKHCTGHVRLSTKTPANVAPHALLPRKVLSSSWYTGLSEVGYNYGPAFQGLQDISASTSELTATASTGNFQSPDDSHYFLHPVTIDICLQLFTIAVSQGHSRKLEQLAVPTNIEYLEISTTNSRIQMRADACANRGGAITGSALCVDDDGMPVLRLQGLKLSPLNNDASQHDPHAGAILEWREALEFADLSSLISPLPTRKDELRLTEELALACIVESAHLLQTEVATHHHLNAYNAWLESQSRRAREGNYDLVHQARQIYAMSSSQRTSLINTLAENVLASPAAPFGALVLRVYQNCTKIFRGEVDALELLLEDNALNNLYALGDKCDLTLFAPIFGHNNPRMRILEIGAGTGSLTAELLNVLKFPDGERTYGQYTFTDISAGFLAAAKEKFKSTANIEYSVLDITKDPVDQGFAANSYDLVIASNVLHATPSLKETLCNVRKLLHPDGFLLLQELCPSFQFINFIMGVLPGWWLGAGDGRER
jgi:SAM-dependent methyltransferase